jgi:homopolymeric O-antigen transport system ATP-binding protein
MPPAIRIENLGKRYRVNHAVQRLPYRTLRDSLVSAATAPLRRLRAGGHDGMAEDFWALKDISFDVQPGEVVGIIGRNGAGKSTLLKILSRITKPTTGRVTLRGRVSSLLEVGTGFHPELTGRENVYLNGGILGMSRKEIDRKFDAIVDFSGVEKFLDTPVKRYSSGMQVRLAFAVAAHLEPEILIVDEVLAVGDAEFQKKCLGKMREVSTGGRTVFFVSHNMTAIEALCTRAIVLESGRVIGAGQVQKVIGQYLDSAVAIHEGFCGLASHAGRSAKTPALMQRVCLRSVDGAMSSSFRMRDDLVIEVGFDARGNRIRPVLGIVVKDRFGSPLFGVNNRFISGFQAPEQYNGSVSCCIRSLPLMPGIYSIDLYLGDQYRDIDNVLDATAFEVVSADIYGTGNIPPVGCGPIAWDASWTFSSWQA